MLIELVIAMTFIVVAVGALMSSYAASMVSLHQFGDGRHSAHARGSSDRGLQEPPVRRDSAGVVDHPGGSDPYVTAHSSDASIPSSTGQITGGTPASSCTASTQAVAGCATQTWTGPDNQPYRVDTYIVSCTPTGGRAIKRITVAVRQMVSGSPGSKIWSRATSEFDQSNPPQ